MTTDTSTPMDTSTPTARTATVDPTVRFAPALRSPALVGAKDRDGWVGLFDSDGFVEDPVEASRYRGKARIQRFWDTFIGPQPSVGFEITRDFWAGSNLVRQATVVNITQADPNEQLRVPALIRYSVRGDRVGSLQAVWEPAKVVQWFFGRGMPGIRALSKHGLRMTLKTGIKSGVAFGGTLVGGLGADGARSIVESLRSADPRQWADRAADAQITVGRGPHVDTYEADPGTALEQLQDYVGSVSQLGVDQVVVCGHHVGAFLSEPEGPRALALMLVADRDRKLTEMLAIASDAPLILRAR